MTRRRIQYYTTHDIARMLCVHPKTVRKWIHLGHVTAVRLHGHWRIAEGEIDRLLREDTRAG